VETGQGSQPHLVSVAKRPNHRDGGQRSQQNGRDNQDQRSRRAIDKRKPDNQFADKYASPNRRDEPMAETHFRKLPRGIESGLPFGISACNEIDRKSTRLN